MIQMLLVFLCCFSAVAHVTAFLPPAPHAPPLQIVIPRDAYGLDSITITLQQGHVPYKNPTDAPRNPARPPFYRFSDKLIGWAFAEHNAETGRIEGQFYDAARDNITPFHSTIQRPGISRHLTSTGDSSYTSGGDSDDEENYYSSIYSSEYSTPFEFEFFENSSNNDTEGILCKAVELEETNAAGDRLLAVSSSASVPATVGDHVYYGNNSCYSGDASLHEFALGITIHSSVLDQYGSQSAALAAIETSIAKASVIYEYQFNLQLSIDKVIVSGDTGATGDIYTSCYSDSKQIEDWLTTYVSYRRSTSSSSSSGAWLHFMDCGTSDSYAGIAYVGSAGCGHDKYGYNTGIVKTSYPSTMWRLFAHELGHLFGAHHSTTNGIMSYGSPLVDGRPLFKQERVDEMCPVMENMEAESCEYFSKVPLELVRNLTVAERTCSFSDSSDCNEQSNYCTWSDGECRFQPFHMLPPGTQCRRGSNRRAKWLTSVDAPSMSSCMTACAYDGSCYGVDYNENTLACDMWTVPITRAKILGSSPESRCIILNSDAPLTNLECETSNEECSGNCSFSLLRNTCGDKSFKLMSNDTGQCQYNGRDRSSYRTLTKNIPTLQACMQLCDDSCGAVDYQASRKKCILWNKTKLPTDVGSNNSRNCYVKINI